MSAGPRLSRSLISFEQPAVSALSCLVLAGGIATLGIALYMVVLCYTPLPWSDGWTQIAIVAAGEKPFSLHWLWQQHNEHRLLIPKLLLGLDLEVFQARQGFLLASIFATQLLHFVLLSWSMRVLGGWRGAMWRTGTGLAAFCLFCPTQWENLTWGFQTCFVLPPLFASLSFVGLLLYWKTQDHGAWKFVLLSLAAALAATVSMASGLVLLPLLALAALALRLRWTVVSTYALTAAAGFALYFHGYTLPSQKSDPVRALHVPAKVLSYVATYFGSVWTAGHSWDGHNLEIARYAGLCGMAIFLGLLLCVRGKLGQPAYTSQMVLLALFCLGTALLTASGRIVYGDSQAFSSRYQGVALLFWFSLGCLALLAVGNLQRGGLLAMQLLLAFVLVRGAALAHLPQRDAREHAFQQRAAAAALLSGIADREQIAQTSSDPDYVLHLVPVMQEHHLSIFAEQRRVELGQPLNSFARMVDGAQCRGALQSVSKIENGSEPGLRISGWAWDVNGHRPAVGIVTVADGSVVGIGAVGDWRPVLRFTHPYLNTSFVGFTAYAKLSSPGPVNVYAVLGDGARACRIAEIQP